MEVVLSYYNGLRANQAWTRSVTRAEITMEGITYGESDLKFLSGISTPVAKRCVVTEPINIDCLGAVDTCRFHYAV